MKRILLFCCLWVLVACSNPNDPIMGDWIVQNPFYRGIYKIIPDGKGFSGKVLYYNDGTTVFDTSSNKQWYVFQHAVKKDSVYVDGISGASSKTSNGSTKTICLKLTSHDTLEVTSYHFKQPSKELWTRKNK